MSDYIEDSAAELNNAFVTYQCKVEKAIAAMIEHLRVVNGTIPAIHHTASIYRKDNGNTSG